MKKRTPGHDLKFIHAMVKESSLFRTQRRCLLDGVIARFLLEHQYNLRGQRTWLCFGDLDDETLSNKQSPSHLKCPRMHVVPSGNS